MEKIPLTSLLLSAVVSLSAGALRQYYFGNQNLNWKEAQKYCRDNYTDLVTITNTQDQNEAELVIKRANPNPNPAADSNRVWIGLRSTKDSWIWSLSNLTFYTENEFQYRNWQSGQPEGDGNCAYMHDNGQWHDITCTSTKRFICYNASSEGFVPVQEQKNWTEAQRYCRLYHTDLASVRNLTENEEIKKITTPNAGAWIGLHRLWVWSDNSTSTFTHWQTGEPNFEEKRDQVCTTIDIQNYQGRWTDQGCTEPHPFVCYDDKMVLVRENLTWTEALRYCRDRDMDLVSVVSEDIQNRVKNVTASASSPHVWLGLRHSCVVGLWFWVNGQTLCYGQWASGYGTGEENCTTTVRSGAIQTSGQRWISLPEDETNNFICVK
ncbi:C-type mannose receptor 2-like [Pseudorasbora parva]|uniref:C-type mannose receptor 2-like n=1 Tax=Pseudorasbora parva TaxID=51549 RepID=UPI00351E8234